MRKDKRVSAMLLACVLTAVMLFSVFFIALEADHDCSGEDCVICAVLSVCEQALHRLMGFGQTAASALLVSAAAAFVWAGVAHFSRCRTLITLKVKLSD